MQLEDVSLSILEKTVFLTFKSSFTASITRSERLISLILLVNNILSYAVFASFLDIISFFICLSKFFFITN